MTSRPPSRETSDLGARLIIDATVPDRHVTLAEPDTAIAEELGHKDGGRPVEQLYGHSDKRLRRAMIRDAFRQHATVRSLRALREDESE